MKNHYDKEDSYFEYIDGDMPADEKNKFESHLKDCGACRAELEKITSDLKELKTLPEIEPAQNSWVEFVKKTRKAKKAPMPAFVRWAAAAAAICVCLICVLFFAKNVYKEKEVVKKPQKFYYAIIIPKFESPDKLDLVKYLDEKEVN